MASKSSPYFLSILFIIFISSLLLANKVNSASFNFPSFVYPYTNDLVFEGDGFALNGTLQLTKVVNNFPYPNSAGRASFSSPIRLWDSQTGKIAGFTTNFSFIVQPTQSGLGDGIAFFLAPFNSFIPKNSSGGYLGLFNFESALDVYQNRIVAVEFDTFVNSWDPLSAHLGINLNSIASATTSPWEIPSVGLPGFATVSYDPEQLSLNAFVNYPGRAVNASSNSVSFKVDLRTVLPEWVRVGFSGATGQLVEAHSALSWSFSSSFN